MPARHESLKRARKRYEGTVAAKKLHCLRQKAHRERKRNIHRQDKEPHQSQPKSNTEQQHGLSNSAPEEYVVLNKDLAGVRAKDFVQQVRSNEFVQQALPAQDSGSLENLQTIKQKTFVQPDRQNSILSVEAQTKAAMSSVTDNGSPLRTSHGIVMATAITRSHHRQSKLNDSSGKVQCDMCGAWCGPFARRGWWHRGRRTNRQGGKP